MIIFDVGRKIIPKPFFHALQPSWHWSLAFLGALLYGFPSRKLTVIGVTGTKGKTTTCVLLAHVFEAAGYRVGMTTTALFRIAGREWLNDTKQTMQGRFAMQKLLRRMVREGCTVAIIETSSQAIKQFRHKWINYQTAVLTNISPEHIESHGSFEKYRAAKGELFRVIGKHTRSLSVVNLDEKDARYFLHFPAKQKVGFTLHGNISHQTIVHKTITAQKKEVSERQSTFMVGDTSFHLRLGGIFNVANALATIAVAQAHCIQNEDIRQGFDVVATVPGRMEFIDEDQDFTVVVDYAHEPRSLEAIYAALQSTTRGTLIAVLGAAGGGRDKQKRKRLGELAAQYADRVIITEEDPYDENPREIMDMVAEGANFQSADFASPQDLRSLNIENKKKFRGHKKQPIDVKIIEDRKAAIYTAITEAKKGDTVVITGKGCEPWLMRANGKKVPWDDREIAREILRKHVLDTHLK
ncbi:MAG: hypothetical protein COT39_02175 [Parcubacteria group bacterium CG08_land_8_20_14_0_20_48_21]|nr:MAG: hypothetical protein AUK21_01620 [Parcubacteria group bacterium CG2_30_48_51]PIS32873.1 MAG: hypothetical protein COT39_02175 [Parcubacteria group bacterium CG08_land_8_20_14_0_20_48_21]PIW78789.1 MAG: hypothetical protein COZ99_04575 [Parcubacteria group bacterium CG_4_8_14_3_um_filter_48_16]PIY78242.1 MAG: hypothetical protein COY83_00815 [Parcubacteria group bacterium CG_4_10_14_0_8_um_filter_48_154]PIZ77593.1 MAG: hypothetical protein COY03_02200 [bacterium CG_4_10_14_0_2_um_filter_